MMIIAAVLTIALAAPAQAGDLDLRLVDVSGRPVTDAVVTVEPDAGIPKRLIRFRWGATMTQANIAFNPGTLIVPVGATVAFPNKDKVRHHVYSFSKPAKFELKLFGRDETRSYQFKTAGAVAIGCNIHDAMSGYIKVVDTPFAAKSDASGAVQIQAVTAGNASITIWHPRLRGKNNEITLRAVIDPAGTLTRRIQLMLR